MIQLSILIPSIPERILTLGELLSKLQKQVDNIDPSGMIEIISLIDNKQISIGVKRERLKNMASGKFFCFVDDDDDVSDEYVKEIFKGTFKDVDVISFDSWASVDGLEGHISASIENEKNNQFLPDLITYRKPSHVNAWNTKKFKKYKFSDKMYGEDFDFCNQCYPHVKTEYKIDLILHYYIYNASITQAFEKDGKDE